MSAVLLQSGQVNWSGWKEPLSSCLEQQNETRPAAKGYQEHVIAGLFPEGQEEQLPCQVQSEPDISGQYLWRDSATSEELQDLIILVIEDVSH